MKNVKWSDNVCTVGDTCIHGYFTGTDLTLLLKYCPTGNFTPTFYHEKLSASGHRNPEILKGIKDWSRNTKTLFDKEWGYYFIFTETKGQALLSFLKELFPMVRGESGA